MLDNILDRERPEHRYTCEFCAHYIGNETYLAFPEGIPLDIWAAAKVPTVCNKAKYISRITK